MILTCRDFIGFLADYLSGAVPADQRADFDAHLAVCPSCVAYLKTYEETIKLGKMAFGHPDDQVPPEVPEELVKAILNARGKK